MQTQQEQNQSNLDRLAAYRKKLTPEQLCRAHVAQYIAAFGRKHGLFMPKISCAIGIALRIMDLGCRPVTAYAIGAKAIEQIAMTNANPGHASPH